MLNTDDYDLYVAITQRVMLDNFVFWRDSYSQVWRYSLAFAGLPVFYSYLALMTPRQPR